MADRPALTDLQERAEKYATTRDTLFSVIRNDYRALVSALVAVLEEHQPQDDGPMSMVNWTFCSCGAIEVVDMGDGEASLGPAHYPCATRRAIERFINLEEEHD